MNTAKTSASRESEISAASGWIMLPIILALIFGSLALIIYSIAHGVPAQGYPLIALMVTGFLAE